MEKIFVIGDPHFDESNSQETDKLHSKCEEILETRRNEISMIVVLGDVSDKGDYVHHSVIARILSFFNMLSSFCPVYVLVGNHDRPNPKVFLTNEHILQILYPIRGITVVERCHTMEWKGKKICMMPYVQNGLFHKACKKCGIKIKQFDLFFSHQEFKGCKINKLNGEDCDVWSSDYPLNIAGHIHDYEHLDNLIYVGTPYQHGFSERPFKGVWLLDENLELERIELDIPKKIHHKINYSEIESLILEKGAIHKVTITGPREECRDIVHANSEKFIGVKIIYKNLKKGEVKKRKASSVSNLSTEERVKKAMKSDPILKRVYEKYIKESE